MYAMKDAILLGVTSLLVAYAAADGLKFGYSGSIGPDKWASLSPNNKLCSEGKQQSPVDILKGQLVHNQKLGSLERNYVSANATLINNGYNIALKYDQSVGSIFIDGKNYTLIQMHWHSPSEHTINGKRFPIELHLLHMSNDGSFAAVGILYRYGSPDTFLEEIKDQIAELEKETCRGDQESHVPIGIARTKALKRHTRKYFRYSGSLSTPPCTENVIWTILGKIREMTEEQANELRAPLNAAYRNNSRPTQPLNGRKVQLYEDPDYYEKSSKSKSRFSKCKPKSKSKSKSSDN